ncbi:MAG TPA: ABC transporter ATP-binding protein [Acetobacteraceae bacterium]|nr:ABC transporter ATP-binding protein [Acetobacteraceae bacterium]
MLQLNDVSVVYEGAILVLKAVSLTVEKGCITTLLGANGAGKTTTLKAISGLLYGERGEVTQGTIMLEGESIKGLPAHELVTRGVAQVFEGRRVFANLTVEENLMVGGHIRPSREQVRASIDEVYALFPRLRERRRQAAGYLSGGEQQMLAIGRALISDPRLILLDEPSLGLAPLIVEEIFRTIVRLKQDLGKTVLIVEQNAGVALEIADWAYVMETGRIVMNGPAGSVRADRAVQHSYLGLNEAGERRSFREARPVRRRARWL